MVQSKVIQKMTALYGKDVRRINHALKVYVFAVYIADQEKLSTVEMEILKMAAILHDIGIPEAEKKYNSSAGKYQQIEGPPIARAMLEELSVNPPTIDRVCYLIGNHHSYAKIDNIDFQILVEADLLVNIFEDEKYKANTESIRKKYFKTQTGKELFDSMY